MNLSKTLQCMLAAAGFLLATNAFADKGTLHISSQAKVAGEELAAGNYTVRWEDSGPDVQLRIMRGNRSVVIVPAKIVPLEGNSANDTVVLHVDADGSRRLLRMCFSGRKFALEVESDPDATSVTPKG